LNFAPFNKSIGTPLKSNNFTHIYESYINPRGGASKGGARARESQSFDSKLSKEGRFSKDGGRALDNGSLAASENSQEFMTPHNFQKPVNLQPDIDLI